MRPSFAYALARIHARVGLRPAEPVRRRLTATGDFGQFLQSAGAAGYGSWLAKLGPTSGVHAVELALRLVYRARLDEVAEWLPEAWRPAVRWLVLAPELPVLGALLDEREVPDWVRGDPLYSPLFAGGDGNAPDRAAIGHRWPGLGSAAPGGLAGAWCEAALGRMPHLDRDGRTAMEALLRFHAESPDGAIGEVRIGRRFRRAPAASVRVFAWLSLLRGDLDFLRGELAVRRLRSGSEFSGVRAGVAA